MKQTWSRSRIAWRGAKVSRRAYSSSSSEATQKAVIHLPNANVYRFGATSAPVFRDLRWTVNENESWAVIGSGSGEKVTLFQTLLGHLRISPPPPSPAGLFPFLSLPPGPPRDPYTCISMVSFGNRRLASGGAFYDYTARYGAVRDEDRVTLRQSMFPESIPREDFFSEMGREKPVDDTARLPEDIQRFFDELVEKLGLKALLDLPLIALSNGQTRRARIIKAVLSKPELLLLDEPLTGLDVENRPTLLQILHSLHKSRAPRIIIGLRTQDPVPDWITHVALVKNGKVLTGEKDEVLSAIEHENIRKSTSSINVATPPKAAKLLIDMKNVGVKYKTRTVLKNINWEIRQGERWHLQGTNGSGKTTLLSLLTGDHPQSYVQPHLHILSVPRSRIPTPHLHSLVGLVSPELFDAFPRRAPGMTVWEVVGTGFDGGFVSMGKEGVGVGVMTRLDVGSAEGQLEDVIKWRVQRCWEVLEALGPRAWQATDDGSHSETPMTTEDFKNRRFIDLSAGEQRMVLLMRALVGKPPLVFLDEVWSGMDERMVRAARTYLRDGGGVGPEQGVVVITHWEEEVPWGPEDGVRKFRLDGGEGRVEN